MIYRKLSLLIPTALTPLARLLATSHIVPFWSGQSEHLSVRLLFIEYGPVPWVCMTLCAYPMH